MSWQQMQIPQFHTHLQKFSPSFFQSLCKDDITALKSRIQMIKKRGEEVSGAVSSSSSPAGPAHSRSPTASHVPKTDAKALKATLARARELAAKAQRRKEESKQPETQAQNRCVLVCLCYLVGTSGKSLTLLGQRGVFIWQNVMFDFLVTFRTKNEPWLCLTLTVLNECQSSVLTRIITLTYVGIHVFDTCWIFFFFSGKKTLQLARTSSPRGDQKLVPWRP